MIQFTKVILLSSTLSAACLAATDGHAMSIQSGGGFGFAIEQKSSTGFRGAGGSMVLLDGAAKVSDDFAVGVRTIGSGGSSQGAQFYRMGSGLLGRWKITETWHVSGTFGSFQETASDDDVAISYSSRGTFGMIGWERVNAITESLAWLWGGSFALYNGSVTDTSDRGFALNDGASAPTSLIKIPDSNQSIQQGILVALRMSF